MSKLKQYNGKEWVDVAVDGMSAYELWVSQGNEGTLEDFFNSFKGPQGEPGKDADTTVVIETVTKTVMEDANKEYERIKKHVASKSYSMSDLTDTQSATTGQTMVKQANGTWAPTTPSGAGDMVKAVYDTDDDGVIDEAAAIEGVGTAGNSKYYGTNASGTPGFFDIAAGTTVDVVSNVAADRILGRVTAGSGDSEELTATQVRTLINVEDGADVTDTANVTAAGALMDSEVTNLAAVKAFNPADYADASHTHATSDITSGTFDDARIAESNVTQHEGALSITESQISDLKNYQIKAVANGSLTAINDTFYVCVSNSTFTDPTPTEGEGFAVLVRNGTATVGGTGYSTAGTIIHRTFHSGSWTNYVYLPSSSYYAPGGTDVALADGGTGASLTDPNADRIMFWDDSAGAVTWLTASTGLTISGTNMTVRTSSATQTGIVELATDAETVTGTDTTRATTPANITARLAAPGTIGGTTPGAGTFTDLTSTGVLTYDAARGKVTTGGNLGATETINFNDETNYTGTLDSNITFTFANATSGDDVTLILSYDGTAQRTITWPTITWLDNNNGSAPATPSASGNVLVVTIRYVGTTYYGSATGNYAVYT